MAPFIPAKAFMLTWFIPFNPGIMFMLTGIPTTFIPAMFTPWGDIICFGERWASAWVVDLGIGHSYVGRHSGVAAVESGSLLNRIAVVVGQSFGSGAERP